MKFFHLGCLVLFLSPAAAFGQTVGTVDACQNLRNEITAATEASGARNTLMQTEGDEEKYLNDLYEGVKSLSATGEMFFKASDSHEVACKEALKKEGKLDELLAMYDWYLEPAQQAYRFFHRARAAAIHLKHQEDVDTLTSTIVEYQSAVMKLVGVCESDLEGTPQKAGCASLSAKLAEAIP